MADAAAATRYLYKSAVERLDGIVTDKNGKPLAVVGGFKGALSEARVFPTTMIAEAVRVPGAAQLWLSHNHPSGTAELSRADEKLAGEIKRVFDGSGIEVKGIVAVAGEKYAEYEPQVGMSFGQRQIPAAAGEVDVPVIERELADRAQPKPAAIQSPAEAKRAAADFYRQGDALLVRAGEDHRIPSGRVEVRRAIGGHDASLTIISSKRASSST
jgi:hypothetical protein